MGEPVLHTFEPLAASRSAHAAWTPSAKSYTQPLHPQRTPLRNQPFAADKVADKLRYNEKDVPGRGMAGC